jgi:hypothetical protein
MVTLMANNHDFLGKDTNSGNSKNKIENMYLLGISNLQAYIKTKEPSLQKFKKHLNFDYQIEEELLEGENADSNNGSSGKSSDSCDD